MKRMKIKPGHAGPKHRGGFWGSREEAKDLARMVRRRLDKQIIEQEVIAMCGRADDPSQHDDEEWALVLEEEGVLAMDPYLDAVLAADRDDPSIDYPSEV